jgi:hypothetical protein
MSHCCHMHATLQPKVKIYVCIISAVFQIKYQLFRAVTQRLVVFTHVSVQPMVPFSRIEQKQSNNFTCIFQAVEFQGVEALRFLYNLHKRVVKLSTIGTGHLYPQEILLASVWLETESNSGP